MNPKFLQKVKALSKNLANNLVNNQQTLLNELNSMRNNNLAKELDKKIEKVSQHLKPLKEYLPPNLNPNFFSASKQPDNENQEETLKNRPPRKRREAESPQQTQGSVFQDTLDTMKKTAEDKFETLSTSAQQYKQDLQKQSKDRLEQLSSVINKQKEELSRAGRQKINSTSSEWKKRVDSSWSEIEEGKKVLLDKIQNKFQNRKKEENVEQVKKNFKKANTTHFQFIKQKVQGLDQYLKKYKKTAQQRGEDSSSKLAEHSDRLAKAVKGKLNSAANAKTDFIGKLISKIFWRFALLICLAAFGYGIGTSLPRQLREYFHLKKKSSQTKESKSVSEDQ